MIAERLANREQAAELYKRKYKEAWDELSVEREKHKWIPVKERLPKNGTRVLVTFEDGFVAAADYYGNGWDLWADSGDVIAWMPLPEAYHPEPKATASKPPEWEQRMMNTFLGSRQEKKKEREKK